MKNIEEGLFLRRATGLVRTASGIDVLIFNVGLISLGFAIAFTQAFVPAFYPGANIFYATLLSVIGMVFVGLGFYFWSIIMPRSGGSYVFLSRAVHPALGFAISWVEVIVMLFYVGFAGTLIISTGIKTFLYSCGIILRKNVYINLVNFFSHPLAQFVIASTIIGLTGYILIRGMKRYFLLQKILFVFAVLGIVIVALLLIFSSKQDFINAFNNVFGENKYQEEINLAQTNGWTKSEFSLVNTIKSMVWPMAGLVAGVVSIGIAGEIRKIRKNQIFGILGAIVISGLVIITLFYLFYAVFGYDFLGAVSYNFFNNKAGIIQTEPFFPLLVGILTNNLFLTTCVSISFMIWFYFFIPTQLTYANRSMLAWAFDRLAPDKLGDVDDKYHTPTTAIIVSVIVTEILLALYVFTPWFKTLTVALTLFIAWGIALLSGVFFPFLRKEIFDKSEIGNYRIVGIPLMSIICFIGGGFLFFIFYLLWNDSFAAGHNLISTLVILITFLSGFVVYFIVKHIRVKQGIEIDKIFKEIPVE